MNGRRKRLFNLILFGVIQFVRHQAEFVDSVTPASSEQPRCLPQNLHFCVWRLHGQHRFAIENRGRRFGQPGIFRPRRHALPVGTGHVAANALGRGFVTFDSGIRDRVTTQGELCRHA